MCSYRVATFTCICRKKLVGCNFFKENKKIKQMGKEEKMKTYFLAALKFFAWCPLFDLQIINVYNQQYESVAAFWPHVHGRIIASLLISQLLLMGLLSTKKAANSTPLLVVLPILTLSFHKYCKSRFEPAFRKYPLEVRPFLTIMRQIYSTISILYSGQVLSVISSRQARTSSLLIPQIWWNPKWYLGYLKIPTFK